MPSKFQPSGMSASQANSTVEILQALLYAETELHLTFKQAHWNVTGPAYIGVHRLLDEGVDLAREMADSSAERIATLGDSPTGTPGAIVANRKHADYPPGKADTQTHLARIDNAISDVVGQLRDAITRTGSTDVITQNLLLGQCEGLEKYQWFIRAHLETPSGTLPSH